MASTRLIVALIALAVAPMATAGEPDPLDSMTADIPNCSESVQCIGLVLHIAADDDGLVQTPEWLAEQVSEANRHFATADVGFEVASVEALGADDAHVATRRQRDRLGRKDFTTGVIHIYIVRRLDNVDAEGEIYGVHWRDRKKRSRRWIIVSSRAWKSTLAHELGHFFGLPHSEYPVSIMNKSRRDDPPAEERRFADEEFETIAARRDKMLKNGQLEAR